MRLRATRWHLLAALLVCTGCSAILGFKDGTPANENDGSQGSACGPGIGPGCASGLQCFDGRCSKGGNCSADGSCADGGSGGSFIASFRGVLGGGMIANKGYVYFTYDHIVAGCDGSKTGVAPKPIYGDDLGQTAPTGPMTLNAGEGLWADPIPGTVRYCDLRELGHCDTAMSNMNEPNTRAMTTDAMGNVYWVRTGVGGGNTTELRRMTPRPARTLSTIATLPATSTIAAVATRGSDRAYVMIGATVFSVATTSDGDAASAVVTPIMTGDVTPTLAPSVAAVVVAAGRVVWTRGSDRGSGMSQCIIRDGANPSCDEVAPFAGAGDEITALVASEDTVVWARHSAQGGDDIYYCKPTPNLFTAAACTRQPLAVALSGRVDAIAVEPPAFGQSATTKDVYFMFTDPSGMHSVAKAQLPRL